MLFADLLSLHLVTFLMFFILVYKVMMYYISKKKNLSYTKHKVSMHQVRTCIK